MPFDAPLSGVARVVNEEHGEHFNPPHYAKRFRAVADLGVVVWAWCCRAK